MHTKKITKYTNTNLFQGEVASPGCQIKTNSKP